jgi:hypothetical protein
VLKVNDALVASYEPRILVSPPVEDHPVVRYRWVFENTVAG